MPIELYHGLEHVMCHSKVSIIELWKRGLWVKQTWFKFGFSTYWQYDLGKFLTASILLPVKIVPTCGRGCWWSTKDMYSSCNFTYGWEEAAQHLSWTMWPDGLMGPMTNESRGSMCPYQAKVVRSSVFCLHCHSLSWWPWRPQDEDGDFLG